MWDDDSFSHVRVSKTMDSISLIEKDYLHTKNIVQIQLHGSFVVFGYFVRCFMT